MVSDNSIENVAEEEVEAIDEVSTEDTVQDISEEKDPIEDISIDEVSVSDDEDNSNWYIVQTLSLHEYKVHFRIQTFIDEKRFGRQLKRVLVPEQKTVEIKHNKRIEKNTKIFPGYVFVKMDMDDEMAYEIKSLPGVTKFMGEGNTPKAVVEDEILKVLRKVGDKTKEVDVDFEVGETIKAISGPFRGYSGVISDINIIKGKVKAKISIFGRETPVELDFEQVEKTI
ncbi:transcription termination/antitermination factor NusG [Candidatus Marinamargulisbacteria bacterium SCGC AG-343-D04]|nr:transcription termination/antitermination factor NusG [Candidatus Marinamargulisbacteria bacterium SCGC AG-343-D04]